MTSRVIRDNGALKQIVISCDNMNCQTSVNDKTIEASGGLTEMGWEAACINNVMRHYCPEHRRTKE